VEQELLNLPEQVKFVDKSLKDNLINLTLPEAACFSGVRDARFLVICVMFCRSLFVFFHLIIVVPVLR